ncbi:Protein kinase domain-containing protein [Mycena chlorophos]|uniref:Protein kinase domain-containing protein n=1 Tax=Mycena chlorophos TaxID=658473 RepID=A0A8H6TBS5_MYCCL|nr:Protein kinase domain-containing protein [Mycena chlorophos]
MRLAPTLLLPALAGAIARASHVVPAHRAAENRREVTVAGLQERQLLGDLGGDLNNLLNNINLCAVIPPSLLTILGINVEAQLCLCIQRLGANVNANLRSAGFDPVDSNALLQNIGQVNQCSATGPTGTVSCASGFILCSGKCVPGTACPTGPSAIPRAVKRDAKKITTLEQAQRECKTGYSVCGVASPETKYDFSCVNTATDLENCGGCTFPSPWQTESQQPLSSELARGYNCGPILNAKAASCVAGQCVVEKCRRGFEVNDQRDGCVHKRRVVRRALLDINIGGPGPVFPPPQAATSFGLGPQFAPHVAGIFHGIHAASAAHGCPPEVITTCNEVLGTTDPEQLVPNVNSAIAAAQAAHNGCDPSQTDLIAALEQLLDGLLGVLSECPSGKVPTIPAAPECDDVVLTRLVCGLVSSIYVSPFFVCGLGDPLTGLLQNVVDLVGLGPFPLPPPPPTCKVGCAPPLPAAPRGLLDGLLGPAPEATSAALSPQFAPSVANVMSGLQAVSAAHGCPSEVIDKCSTMLATTDPTQLVPNVNDAVSAVQAAHHSCSACDPDLLSGLGKLLDGLLGILNECPNGAPPPTVPAPRVCDHVVLTRVVCGILPSVYVAPFVLCGLGEQLTTLVQNVLDPVGLGLLPPPPPPPTCSVGGLPPVGWVPPTGGSGSGSDTSATGLPIDLSHSATPSAPTPTPTTPSGSSSSYGPPPDSDCDPTSDSSSISSPPPDSGSSTSSTSPSNTIDLAGIMLQLSVILNGGGHEVCDGLLGAINQLVQGLFPGTVLFGPGGLIDIGPGDIPSGFDWGKILPVGVPASLPALGGSDPVGSVVDTASGASGALSGVTGTAGSLPVVGGLTGASGAGGPLGSVTNALGGAASGGLPVVGGLTGGSGAGSALSGVTNTLGGAASGGLPVVGSLTGGSAAGAVGGLTGGSSPVGSLTNTVGGLTGGGATGLLGGALGGLRRRDAVSDLLDGLLGNCGDSLVQGVENLVRQLLGGFKTCSCKPEDVTDAVPQAIALASPSSS